MKIAVCWVMLLFPFIAANAKIQRTGFDFYGDSVVLTYDPEARAGYNSCVLSHEDSIAGFYTAADKAGYDAVIASLSLYRETHHPDDWMFYQLVRRTANIISPKADNYDRYTLYKWYLLHKLGYDVRLSVSANYLLLYVQSNDNIYDIPTMMCEGKQYVCLNYHDYGTVDFSENKFSVLNPPHEGAYQVFSYKIAKLPGFSPKDYTEKTLSFNYRGGDYSYTIKLNKQLKVIFENYPVADYQLYFDAPLSKETYASLIPRLKEDVKNVGVKQGVDYLMHFTRYAFAYQTDQQNFGKEKHLSPEETLLSNYSDCEDRAALFYCLVKEIYHLPMIVLEFPHHMTVAVKFDKPVGTPIVYNGAVYSICEPTPQTADLPIGGMGKDLKLLPYQVAYSYMPNK